MSDTMPELVRASQRGDVEAFGLLVGRFQRMACAVAYALLGDAHLAEDAAQEAFIEAYQGLGGLREPAAFPAWLRRIVLKRADRLARGKGPASLPLEAAGALPAAQADPPRLAEQRETSRAVLAAVAALPEPERLMVGLFHLGGYSQREVAAIVELPEQLVKKRLFRARQALRRSMEGTMAELFEGHLAERDAFTRAVQFFIAVRTGDLAQVGRMLDVDPGLAAERERWDEEQSRRSRLPVAGSFTALHRAAYRGDLALAELLLARGASPDARTKIGQTPLHVAVLVDQPALVERLLAAGADVNAATDRGQTPLHWAVIRARPWQIRRLLAAGAGADLPDGEGRSARDWAALKGLDLTQISTEAAHG